MTYVEFVFDTITELHVKKDDGPPPDPGGGGGDDGPCGNGWFAYVNSNNLFAGLGAVGSGVYWNPPFCCPAYPRDYDKDTGHYPGYDFIPGMGSKSVVLSVEWKGVLANPELPTLVVGAWIMENRRPYPPYDIIGKEGTSPPPDRVPPNDPDKSHTVLGAGHMSVVLDPWKDSTVIFTAVGTHAGPPPGPPPPALARMPVLPATRDDPPFVPEFHGFPGEPPPEGIWITVEYVCPPNSGFLSARRPARQRIIRRR